MKFRYARHTNDLGTIIHFYTQILGLEVLGEFKNHAGYNGVFIGRSGLSWHLEFTESEDEAVHHPDVDDLMVFYLSSDEEIKSIVVKAKNHKVNTIEPKNPYWKTNGIELKDPDGFGVMLTLEKNG